MKVVRIEVRVQEQVCWNGTHGEEGRRVGRDTKIRQRANKSIGWKKKILRILKVKVMRVE